MIIYPIWKFKINDVRISLVSFLKWRSNLEKWNLYVCIWTLKTSKIVDSRKWNLNISVCDLIILSSELYAE